MKIKVNQYYQGWNTGEQIIEAGIYEVGDERLFGIEEYLVNEQQKAEYIQDDEPSPELVADVSSENDAQELEFKGRKVKSKKAE